MQSKYSGWLTPNTSDLPPQESNSASALKFYIHMTKFTSNLASSLTVVKSAGNLAFL